MFQIPRILKQCVQTHCSWPPDLKLFDHRIAWEAIFLSITSANLSLKFSHLPSQFSLDTRSLCVFFLPQEGLDLL